MFQIKLDFFFFGNTILLKLVSLDTSSKMLNWNLQFLIHLIVRISSISCILQVGVLNVVEEINSKVTSL